MSSPYRSREKPRFPRCEKLKCAIKKDWSQKEFAEHLGISLSQLNLKLNGFYQFKDFEVAIIEKKTNMKREEW